MTSGCKVAASAEVCQLIAWRVCGLEIGHVSVSQGLPNVHFQVRYLIPYTVFSLTQVLILKPLLRPDLNVSSGSSNGGRCVGMSCAHVTLVFVLIFSC